MKSPTIVFAGLATAIALTGCASGPSGPAYCGQSIGERTAMMPATPYGPLAALFVAVAMEVGCPSREESGRGEPQLSEAEAAEQRETARQEALAKAEQGDADAQYTLYLESEPGADGLYWLCRAANGGSSNAQSVFGDFHAGTSPDNWRSAGLVERDYVRAYMWYGLSGVTVFRDDLAKKKMTRAQIARAKRMTAKWQPNPGECKRPPATKASSG